MVKGLLCDEGCKAHPVVLSTQRSANASSRILSLTLALHAVDSMIHFLNLVGDTVSQILHRFMHFMYPFFEELEDRPVDSQSQIKKSMFTHLLELLLPCFKSGVPSSASEADAKRSALTIPLYAGSTFTPTCRSSTDLIRVTLASCRVVRPRRPRRPS